jgi:hypothetical protein
MAGEVGSEEKSISNDEEQVRSFELDVAEAAEDTARDVGVAVGLVRGIEPEDDELGIKCGLTEAEAEGKVEG